MGAQRDRVCLTWYAMFHFGIKRVYGEGKASLRDGSATCSLKFSVGQLTRIRALEPGGTQLLHSLHTIQYDTTQYNTIFSCETDPLYLAGLLQCDTGDRHLWTRTFGLGGSWRPVD